MNSNSTENETNVIPSLYSDFIYFDYCYDNASMRINVKNPTGINCLGTVKMSPQTLKALQKSVNETVEGYEKIYGKINEYDEEAKKREKDAQKDFLEKEEKAISDELDAIRDRIDEKKKKIEMLKKEEKE